MALAPSRRFPLPPRAAGEPGPRPARRLLGVRLRVADVAARIRLYAFRCKATLRGWRRSLCIYSHVYRGTPERPGLVLGLDRGGACAGVAFRVKASLREPTIRYLRDREQATSVYLERMVPVTLESGERVNALTYVADRLHGQYAGRLDRETMLAIVRAGHGQSGDNAAYVTETHDHLAAIGVHDSDLEWLSARLRGETS